jgi:hypothetical protein
MRGSAGLSQIECKLHSRQVLHLRPERLLDPQAHLARQRRFAIQQTRKRLPPDTDGLRGRIRAERGARVPQNSRAKFSSDCARSFGNGYAFRSPELKNVSRETFPSKTPANDNAFRELSRDLTAICVGQSGKDQLIVSGVSANSFFSASQAKAAARANLPARIDSTMYTVSG